MRDEGQIRQAQPLVVHSIHVASRHKWVQIDITPSVLVDALHLGNLKGLPWRICP